MSFKRCYFWKNGVYFLTWHVEIIKSELVVELCVDPYIEPISQPYT